MHRTSGHIISTNEEFIQLYNNKIFRFIQNLVAYLSRYQQFRHYSLLYLR